MIQIGVEVFRCRGTLGDTPSADLVSDTWFCCVIPLSKDNAELSRRPKLAERVRRRLRLAAA